MRKKMNGVACSRREGDSIPAKRFNKYFVDRRKNGKI